MVTYGNNNTLNFERLAPKTDDSRGYGPNSRSINMPMEYYKQETHMPPQANVNLNMPDKGLTIPMANGGYNQGEIRQSPAQPQHPP
jgi:hypothetical protein